MSESATAWCPSCGAEYVAGVPYCADCRVGLVAQQPTRLEPIDDAAVDADLVAIGGWARLAAQILRARMETAGISVMVEWSSPGPDAIGTLVVPADQREFAEAVVHELDVAEEVPDTSPEAFVARIEEHLAAAASLLQQLRTRLEAPDGE